VSPVPASAGGVSASLDLVLSDGELESEMDRRIGLSSTDQNSLEGLYIPSDLGTPQEELESVAVEMDGWVYLLDLLVLRPDLR